MDSNLVLIYTRGDKVVQCDNPHCDWYGTASNLVAEKTAGKPAYRSLKCPKCGSRLGLDIITTGKE